MDFYARRGHHYRNMPPRRRIGCTMLATTCGLNTILFVVVMCRAIPVGVTKKLRWTRLVHLRFWMLQTWLTHSIPDGTGWIVYFSDWNIRDSAALIRFSGAPRFARTVIRYLMREGCWNHTVTYIPCPFPQHRRVIPEIDATKWCKMLSKSLK